MITDIPGTTPFARTALLAAATINATVLVICWSAAISAEGAAAFILGYSATSAYTYTIVTFTITACIAFRETKSKKPLDMSASIIATISIFLCTINAISITHGYMRTALTQDQSQLATCTRNMMRSHTPLDRFRYSLSSAFVIADMTESCFD